tara:strand:- start:307 stop:1530 length:1224 start_codon:yes stop_codon:yes gene_type:complete
MILFINTFITNKRFFPSLRVQPNDSRYLPSRVDIFKFQLSSLSDIDWEEVVVYYELDDEFSEHYSDIDMYIDSLFTCEKFIYHYRNKDQSMWQESVHKLDRFSDDQLIWFTCDDDHIFIDSSLYHLQHIIEKQQEMLKTYPYVTSFLSHWPELMALRKNEGKFNREIVEDNKKYFVMEWKNGDGISIINKGLLKYWWFENDYGNAIFRRTDDPENEVISPLTKTIVPYRELVRHFDGYGHIGINPDDCPPLFIPNGFFQSQIKISSQKRPSSNNYVYLDVQNKKTKAFTDSGSDIRCLVDEIPNFWKSKIVEIIDECQDESKVMTFRNRSIIALACSDKRGNWTPLGVAFKLKNSYFNNRNFLLLILDSIAVWKFRDYILHFTFVFKRHFPRLSGFIYPLYKAIFKI